MAKVKGTAVSASVTYLKQRLGEERFAQIVSQMPAAEAGVIRGTVLPSQWYEFSLLLELMKRAEPHLQSASGRSLAWEMGRYSAEAGLKTVYKIFFKVADPGYIIKKASHVFSNYYDSGAMEVVDSGPKHAVLRLTGFNQPCPPFCDRLLGWMERTVELTGAKGVVMSHPECLSRGDDCCKYRGEWT